MCGCTCSLPCRAKRKAGTCTCCSTCRMPRPASGSRRSAGGGMRSVGGSGVERQVVRWKLGGGRWRRAISGRSERRAPARAAARAGCLGRRAAACVRRAAGVRSVGGSGRAAATSLGPHHVYACCVAGAGNDSDPAALRQPGAACGRRRAVREGERGGQRLEPGRPPHPEGAHARGTASSNADRPFRSPWPRTAHAVPGRSDSGLVCERWNWSGGDVAATAAAGAGLGGVRSSGGAGAGVRQRAACVGGAAHGAYHTAGPCRPGRGTRHRTVVRLPRG